MKTILMDNSRPLRSQIEILRVKQHRGGLRKTSGMEKGRTELYATSGAQVGGRGEDGPYRVPRSSTTDWMAVIITLSGEAELWLGDFERTQEKERRIKIPGATSSGQAGAEKKISKAGGTRWTSRMCLGWEHRLEPTMWCYRTSPEGYSEPVASHNT